MTDFSHRSRRAEWMDDPSVSFDEFRACLVDLARVNVLTLAHRPTLRFLDRLLPHARALGRPIEILDVGSGYGDLLRQIAQWARRRSVDVSLTGVDRNPWARRAAIEATPSELDIEWVTADAFAYAPSRGVDIIVSSCLTHHLSDARVVGFLGWMEANARLGWFVNDLHRHPLPYHVFSWLAELARFHHFVRHDGPVSIARAFVAADWHRMLAAASIEPSEADVQWMFPFRLTVTRYKERWR